MLPELREPSARSQEFIDGAVLDDASAFHEDDAVCRANAGQPMSDDHPGAGCGICGESGGHGRFVLRVERARRLVHEKEGSVFDQRSGYRHTLTLPARQGGAALPDARFPAVR